MASLLTDAEKATLQSQFQDVIDTFSYPITGYKETNISSLSADTSYNYLYANSQPTVELTTTTVSGVFNARILYLNPESNYIKNIPIDDTQLKVAKGFIRIKLDEAGYQFIKSSKYVKLDDQTCQIVSIPRRHGLFNPTHVTLYLMMVD